MPNVTSWNDDKLFLGIAAAVIFLAGCSSSLSPNHLQEMSFKHVIIDSNPNTGADCCTDVCAVGDINGDGYLDIVIGAQNAAANGLVWYEYPQWTKHPVASGQFTTDGQTGDVDGDGDPDIIISESGSGIVWYENHHNPTAAAWTAHKIGSGYGHDLEAGDVDGDGDLDVVTCDKTRVVLWQQINPTAWNELTILAKDGEGTALADLDRDGDLDVVYGGLWLETPDSLNRSPWPQHIIAPSWPGAARAKVADINRDGRLDVILSVSEASGHLAWFEAPVNLQTGSWQEHVIEAAALEGAHSLQVVDMDNDKDLDVVTAEMHISMQKRVIVYINEQNLWRRQIVSATGSHNLRVGDIGNDGDMDIIGKNFAGDGRLIEMWENETVVVTKVGHTIAPNIFALSQCFPNPFLRSKNGIGRGVILLELILAKSCEVDLHILNLTGQKVRTLDKGWRGAGRSLLQWDGRDEHGMPAPAGLYVLRLQTPTQQAIRKVTLM